MAAPMTASTNPSSVSRTMSNTSWCSLPSPAEIAQDNVEERQQLRPYETPVFRGYHMEARGIELRQPHVSRVANRMIT